MENAAMQIDPVFEPHEITLHLAPTDKITTWWCIVCRNKLFSSHHRLIAITEEGPLAILAFPIIIPCKRCRSSYSIQTII